MAGLHSSEGARGALRIRQRELRQLLSVELGKPRLELGAIDGHPGGDVPVFLADEPFDLDLAVDDDAQRHRLHAARRTRTRQLAPQHGRQREAHQIVERAAGEIRIHQLLVDLARVLDRFRHRLLGDGVERHALDRLALQHLAVVERFQHVPRDRFSLAIRVGCEDEAVGRLHRIRDILDVFCRLPVDVPGHRKVIVRTYGTVLGGQVADMAVRGHHLVPGAQVLVDGLDLTRRLYDDDLHFSSCFQGVCGRMRREGEGQGLECQFAQP